MFSRRFLILCLALMLSTATFAAGKLDIRTRVVHLHHAAVKDAVHTLHWDDMNDLPAGVVDIAIDVKRQAIRIEGTPAGIATAVQEIGFVDIAPRRVRIDVRIAVLHKPAAVRRGRSLPTAQAVLASAYRVVPALTQDAGNNDEATIRVRVVRPVSGAQYVDSGLHLSPTVGVNAVTVRGSLDIDALLQDLDLQAATPDSTGMIALVRTARNGRAIVMGAFHARPPGDTSGSTRYVYVVITASKL